MHATMKALVKKERAPGLWLEEVPVPEYGINDVLIKIRKAAICGTDLHIWNWDAWAQKTIPVPMVVGHEFVGTVAAMGSNVTDLKVGDVVSGEGHLVCGLGQRARSTCAFTVADRDCLALRASAVNATRNGIASVTSLAVASPVATVASIPNRGADWVVVNDDPAPGSRWNEEILALASHAMNDTGKLIVISRTTTLGRLEKLGGALRMIDERRMHGYCARLYRRGKLT